MKSFIQLVKKSVYDRAEKISSTRIQAYITFGAILVMAGMYVIMFLANAGLSLFYHKTVYIPSNEEIIIFGMILGHHLALLGIKNTGDKSLPTLSSRTTLKPNDSGELAINDSHLKGDEVVPDFIEPDVGKKQ